MMNSMPQFYMNWRMDIRHNYIKTKEKYRIKEGVLCIHFEEQSDEVEYWRIIIPNDIVIKKQILKECHSVPYSAHPGVQRTLSRIHRVFY